jgi:hypothetical protein
VDFKGSDTFCGSVCAANPQKVLRALVDPLTGALRQTPKWLKSSSERQSDNSGTVPIWTPKGGQNGPRSTPSLPSVPLSQTFGSPIAIYQTRSEGVFSEVRGSKREEWSDVRATPDLVTRVKSARLQTNKTSEKHSPSSFIHLCPVFCK